MLKSFRSLQIRRTFRRENCCWCTFCSIDCWLIFKSVELNLNVRVEIGFTVQVNKGKRKYWQPYLYQNWTSTNILSDRLEYTKQRSYSNALILKNPFFLGMGVLSFYSCLAFHLIFNASRLSIFLILCSVRFSWFDPMKKTHQLPPP